MAADGGIEHGIRKAEVLHVHQLESHRKVGWGFSPGELDHARRQVDPNQLAIRRDVAREAIAQRPRPAGEIEDALARTGVDPLDDGGPTARLAASHHLLEPLLVGGGMPAEGARVKVLGGWLVQKKKAGVALPPSA